MGHASFSHIRNFHQENSSFSMPGFERVVLQTGSMWAQIPLQLSVRSAAFIRWKLKTFLSTVVLLWAPDWLSSLAATMRIFDGDIHQFVIDRPNYKATQFQDWKNKSSAKEYSFSNSVIAWFIEKHSINWRSIPRLWLSIEYASSHPFGM